MIVVFLGPPGAGKGTQCKILAERYNLKHLSSGDILRRERQQATQLGQKAQKYMDSGKLVPDDLIVAMMSKEITDGSDDGAAGVILDGFPRTIQQAQELDKALAAAGKQVDAVLNLEVNDEKLETRITGRRSCSQCGTAYHIMFNKPKQQGVCDKDGAELVQRSDDTAQVVRSRIQTYHEQTAPLVTYYRAKGNIHSIDGNVTIEDVTRNMCEVVDKLNSQENKYE
jgi:adenylate kinase